MLGTCFGNLRSWETADYEDMFRDDICAKQCLRKLVFIVKLAYYTQSGIELEIK